MFVTNSLHRDIFLICPLPLFSGYVEFWSPEACDKAAALNGKNLLGRPIRIDWTD